MEVDSKDIIIVDNPLESIRDTKQDVKEDTKDGTPMMMMSRAVSGLPWVEKHRPKTLDDVAGNADIIQRLKLIAANGCFPNMMVAGPPGSGKTTSVLCLARALLGPHVQDLRDGVLELNASDDRGIDVVRGKIKEFARKKLTLPEGIQKLVVLDEADSMMPQAQHALLRSMDRYVGTTRFAVICNAASNIIDAIQSRCIILRFHRLEDKLVQWRLEQICAEENVLTCTPDGMEALTFVAQGDMRQAISTLQATYAGLEMVTAENVYKVADQPQPLAIKSILDSCAKKDVKTACGAVRQLWKRGHAAIDIINTMLRVCRATPTSAPPSASTSATAQNGKISTTSHDSKVIATKAQASIVGGNLQAKAQSSMHGSAIGERQKILFLKELEFQHVRTSNGLTSLLQLTGLIARLCSI